MENQQETSLHPKRLDSSKKIISSELTLSQAVNGTPIQSLCIQKGEQEVLMDISMILSKWLQAFNVSATMNPYQIKQFASDFITHWDGESLEDLELTLKMASMSEFGPCYRIDSSVIFGWFRQYLDLKYAERERQEQSKKKEHEQNKPITAHIDSIPKEGKGWAYWGPKIQDAIKKGEQRKVENEKMRQKVINRMEELKKAVQKIPVDELKQNIIDFERVNTNGSLSSEIQLLKAELKLRTSKSTQQQL